MGGEGKGEKGSGWGGEWVGRGRVRREWVGRGR